jgi:hypothetical protein
MSKHLWDTAIGDVVDYRGSFVANGATPVTVSNVPLGAHATIEIMLGTVGGTVGAVPAVQTITKSTSAGTGPQGSPAFNGSFTVSGTAGDTSTYNFRIIN